MTSPSQPTSPSLDAERRAHKVMTAFEYISTPIIGWHEVCRNVDGFEGVGVRYLGEAALSAPRATSPSVDASEILAAFLKEVPASDNSSADDDSSFGIEWHFSDGSVFWIDIDPIYGPRYFWRKQGGIGHSAALSAPRVEPVAENTTGENANIHAAPSSTMGGKFHRPLCSKCGLEDGACICAHLAPPSQPDTGVRAAFRAGWYVNAAAEQPADYLSGCEEVDWKDYAKSAEVPTEKSTASWLWACTGCGSQKTMDQIKGEYPNVLSCCPERKMAPPPAPPDAGSRKPQIGAVEPIPSDGEIYAMVSQIGMSSDEIESINDAIDIAIRAGSRKPVLDPATVEVRNISDEDMRDLLSAKDVGTGRAKLKRILRSLGEDS